MQTGNTDNNKPILFITFNDTENEAIRTCFKNAQDIPYKKQGFMLTRGIFGNHVALHYHSPEKGDGAELYINRVLNTLRFSAIVLVGIACGANVQANDNKQAVGDVLLSKELINARELRIGDQTVIRGARIPSGDRLYEFFFNARHTWTVGEREVSSKALVHTGSILSGAPLVDNLEKKKELFALYHNEPIGYEMEGTSLFKVCHSREVGHTEWIIVKGVSDFGDGTKGEEKDKRQKLASQNAVSFCLHTFSREGFEYYGARTANEISPNEIEKPTVFISYNRNDFDYANMLESGIQDIAEVHRDTKDIQSWGSITDFMNTIGIRDFAVLVISDEYLKSHYCLYEVVQLMKQSVWEDKSMYVIMDSAKGIYKTQTRIEYSNHWAQATNDLEKRIAQLPPAASSPYVDELKMYNFILLSIGDFMAKVSDANNPPCDKAVSEIRKRINTYSNNNVTSETGDNVGSSKANKTDNYSVMAEILAKYADKIFKDQSLNGFAWGQNMTVLRCPKEDWWKTSDIQFDLQNIEYSLSKLCDYDRDLNKETLADGFQNYSSYIFPKTNSENKDRLMLANRPYSFTDNAGLILQLVKTDWRTLQYFWHTLMNEAKRKIYIDDYFINEDIKFPNSLCLHLVIITNEGKVMLTRNNPTKNDKKGWAVSLGEQISPDDIATAFYICKNRHCEEQAFTEEEWKKVQNVWDKKYPYYFNGVISDNNKKFLTKYEAENNPLFNEYILSKKDEPERYYVPKGPDEDCAAIWIQRTLKEELGIEESSGFYNIDDARFVALNLEGDMPNLTLCCILSLNVKSTELLNKLRVNERIDYEFHEVGFIDIDEIPNELLGITQNFYPYHPSSHIRMAYAYIFRKSYEELLLAFSESYQNGGMKEYGQGFFCSRP